MLACATADMQPALAALTQAEHLLQQHGTEPGQGFLWPLDAFALEATFPEGMQLYAGGDWAALDVVRAAAAGALFCHARAGGLLCGAALRLAEWFSECLATGSMRSPKAMRRACSSSAHAMHAQLATAGAAEAQPAAAAGGGSACGDPAAGGGVHPGDQDGAAPNRAPPQ